MGEYKAIMKLIDDKLAHDEIVLESYRKENDELKKELDELTWENECLGKANESLTEELKRQDGVISELKEKIESEKKIKKVDV
jgi:regulator of replication initiation timing